MEGFNYDLIRDTAKDLYIRALKILPDDVKDALRRAHDAETPSGRKEDPGDDAGERRCGRSKGSLSLPGYWNSHI